MQKFTVLPKRPFVFYRKIRHLQLYLNVHLFYYYETQNLEFFLDSQLLYLPQNTKFKIVPKGKLNTKLFKLFPSSNLLFDNKLENLKMYTDGHLFFDRNIKIGIELKRTRFLITNNKNRT